MPSCNHFEKRSEADRQDNCPNCTNWKKTKCGIENKLKEDLHEALLIVRAK